MRDSQCRQSLRLRETICIYLTTLLIILGVLVSSFNTTIPRHSSFPYRVPLDPQGVAELDWNVSYSQEVVYFRLLLRQLKFGIIFGMSDRGDIGNADLAILWSDGRNSYFGDAWTDDEARVHLDTQQDYQLIDAHQSAQGLYLTFKRPFNTCDQRDYIIERGTVHLLYRFLNHPIASLQSIDLKELAGGLQRVQLLKPMIQTPTLPSDIKILEVLAPNVTIPDQETTYWCYITKLPRDFPAHHIVMYEPVIVKGNEAIVHHMEVFQCAPELDRIPFYSGPCDSRMKPPRLNFCRHVLAAWAMGAQPFYYPKDVGLMIGGANFSKYLRLEVHYHNPLRLSVKAQEITQPQEIRLLQKEITVKPGDVLITSCTYNTEGRSHVTVGGFGINEEMCVNYVHYYPQTQLELCKSAVDISYLQKYFTFINRIDDDRICSCPQVPVTQQFDAVPWSSFSSQVLKAMYDFAPISVHCNKSSAVSFPGNWDKQPLPRVTAALSKSQDHCQRSSHMTPGEATMVQLTANKPGE
ncbi:hypothetical protein chiPu_0020934 [Chiloscyllium punctatum]|uniref:Dopamine beta-hydroxylase n=1 Tax=Chiloscyllium punctatum TaxID=137246 RepID=A0A401RLD0_CHIPU|nr:hypothetical protein [Chiloscyllium punctatum]